MNFRTGYNYDSDRVSLETGLVCSDDTLTQQNFKDEADINTIVRRFGLTGELPSDVKMPVSGDFVDATTYHEAMNLVRSASEEFLRIPADIRFRFGNDPAALMMFLEDDNNRDEAKRLGLLRPDPPPPVPLDVRVIPDTK